jgi:hypothetical protein
MDLACPSTHTFQKHQREMGPKIHSAFRNNVLGYREKLGDTLEFIATDSAFSQRRQGNDEFDPVIVSDPDSTRMKIIAQAHVSRHREDLPTKGSDGNFPKKVNGSQNHLGSSNSMSAVSAEQNFRDLYSTNPKLKILSICTDGDDSTHKIARKVAAEEKAKKGIQLLPEEL